MRNVGIVGLIIGALLVLSLGCASGLSEDEVIRLIQSHSTPAHRESKGRPARKGLWARRDRRDGVEKSALKGLPVLLVSAALRVK